jgi:DivIVA domain-containing protein
MAMTPGDIESRAFRTVRKGYAPEEVRSFLHEIAASVAAQPRPELVQVGAEVANVLESAHRTASEIEGHARTRAAEIIAEAEAVVAAQRGDIQRVKIQAEVELTNARAEAKRIRSEAEAFSTQHRTSAEQAKMEPNPSPRPSRPASSSCGRASTPRPRRARARPTTTPSGCASEADEAVRICEPRPKNAPPHHAPSRRGTRGRARRDARGRRRRERARRWSAGRGARATMVAEAEATASRLRRQRQGASREERLAAQERAQQRSTEILNQSQERLDLILATERRTHERLLAALAEVQTASIW